MTEKPIIWTEGIIGSGKSTLCEGLAKTFNLRIMREPVDSNPYLSEFYKNPKKHAFAMQIHLLGIREGMQSLAANEALFGDHFQGVILDRGLPGDHCFARLHMKYGNMTKLNYETYKMLYLRHTNGLKPPSMMLFLDIEPDVALRRIRKRGRDAEKGITLKYLTDLRDQYLDLLVELQAGEHEWCGKVEIKRFCYNSDHNHRPIYDFLRNRFGLQR